MHTSQNFSALTGIGHHVKFIADLTVEPELRAVAEIGGKTHRRIDGDAALAGNDALNPAWGHTRIQRQTCLAQAHRLQKFLIQNFARMNGRHAVMHDLLLMVINNFNTMRASISPGKADAPLAVDADAVLPGSVAFEGFQPVPWGNAQVIQGDGVVQDFELAHGCTLDIRRQPLNPDAQEEAFRAAVFVAHNHGKNITRKTCNRKRIASESRGCPA